jgi:hypothetical protein
MDPIYTSFGVLEVGNLTIFNEVQFEKKKSIIPISERSKFDKSTEVKLIQLSKV